ncbi:MAG: type II toxin-antitoxin system VapC family toxin [Deltaproteobacteria bacterium]|nr:type II toxin-antitoxin system VapC family toxin [Deltaproteobacteria bacterium]
MAVLVDSNVILDIVTEDRQWFPWSSETLSRYAEGSILVINPIIYAEVSIAFERIEEVDEVLPQDYFRRHPLPWQAAFLAGKCFQAYRRRSGKKRSPLPDFYIGAHAAVAGMALITRDAGRYRTYFPGLTIIGPVEHQGPAAP